MKRTLLLLLSICLLFGCAKTPPVPRSGIWQATLDLGPGRLPFNFELKRVEDSFQLTVINDAERLEAESVSLDGDSVFIRMDYFNSEIRAAITDSLHLKGYWQDHSRGKDYRIPFSAKQGEISRFPVRSNEFEDFSGKWETVFSPDDSLEAYPAIGLFEQQSRRINGTFLTETGDYRFLQGVADGDSLKLSAFDGSHAFLFLARLQNDSLKGMFYSGTHWIEPWFAIRNPNARLRDPDSLTNLKPGYDQLDFTFPNLKGTPVSLSDDRFQDKVVLVQLMGSWCPNCLDETKLFSRFFDKYHDKGLEIVGLAFERESDQEIAVRILSRLQERLKVNYDFLLADFTGEKDAAARALPMVNRIMAFPTTFFIDRNGRIRKIHTGFYGPGTGDLYTRFVEKYSAFIEKLLAEKPTPSSHSAQSGSKSRQ